MFTNQENQNPKAAAETPSTATTLTPEAVIETLRTVRSQIGEVTPLTPEQRKTLRYRANTPQPVLQAGINVIDAMDNVVAAVGKPAAEVRAMFDEAMRWSAVEDELRGMLNGISGANLIRRQRLGLVAKQAATIAAELALDPANAALVPHVLEISRLKSFKRRKKAADAPTTTPSPGTVPGTSGTTKPQ